jgi:hypothetical protein
MILQMQAGNRETAVILCKRQAFWETSSHSHAWSPHIICSFYVHSGHCSMYMLSKVKWPVELLTVVWASLLCCKNTIMSEIQHGYPTAHYITRHVWYVISSNRFLHCTLHYTWHVWFASVLTGFSTAHYTTHDMYDMSSVLTGFSTAHYTTWHVWYVISSNRFLHCTLHYTWHMICHKFSPVSPLHTTQHMTYDMS